MNEEISKEDQDWLNALSGRTNEGVEPLLSDQASAVRNALLARRDDIEAGAHSVGNKGLDELRARLRREGLMQATKGSHFKTTWWTGAINLFGLGSGGVGAKAVPIWSVAAIVAVAAVVIFQVRGPQTDESLVYRGDPSTTILIHDDPKRRESELSTALRQISQSVEVTQLSNGGFHLKVQQSQAVIDYLQTQRIEPVVVSGFITIDIIPTKK